MDADSKKDDYERFQRLIVKKRQEKKVLISTTVLYNGVSLEDASLKHIVVDSINKSEVVQMLGRKRCSKGERVNLYVKIPTKEELKKYYNNVNSLLEFVSEYYKNPELFMETKWSQDYFDPRLRKLFQFVCRDNTI